METKKATRTPLIYGVAAWKDNHMYKVYIKQAEGQDVFNEGIIATHLDLLGFEEFLIHEVKPDKLAKNEWEYVGSLFPEAYAKAKEAWKMKAYSKIASAFNLPR